MVNIKMNINDGWFYGGLENHTIGTLPETLDRHTMTCIAVHRILPAPDVSAARSTSLKNNDMSLCMRKPTIWVSGPGSTQTGMKVAEAGSKRSDLRFTSENSGKHVHETPHFYILKLGTVYFSYFCSKI